MNTSADHSGSFSNVEPQHIISVNKFIFLSFITLGLYPIWWIYKAWRFFQQKENTDIMPALRAILSLIYLIPLYNKILTFAKEKGYHGNYNSVLLFLGLFVCNFQARLPEPYALLAIFSFVFMIPPVLALNYAKQSSTDFEVVERNSFNGRQIALIVVGSILWAMVILGISME